MASGTVTWVDSRTGYGFVAPEGGGKDLFLHPADIVSGSKTLVVGATVEFGRGVGINGRIIATDVVLRAPEVALETESRPRLGVVRLSEDVAVSALWPSV